MRSTTIWGSPSRRAILSEYTPLARRTHELQTTVPYLAQLARAAHAEPEVDGFVQEMVALIDAATHVRYDTIPALRLICTGPGQGSRGDPARLGRLVRAHEQMQGRQSQAALHEAQGIASRVAGDLQEAARLLRAAAAGWQTLGRLFDQARALSQLGQVGIQHGKREEAYRALDQAWHIVEALAEQVEEAELKRAFLGSAFVREIRARRAALPANSRPT